jgi:hypothetical protein
MVKLLLALSIAAGLLFGSHTPKTPKVHAMGPGSPPAPTCPYDGCTK